MERTKEEIMRKCEQGEPELFMQFSAWDYNNVDKQMQGEFYGIGVRMDKDSHCFDEELVYELIQGADVRILVNPKVSRTIAIQLLRKIMNCIEKDISFRFVAEEELRKITKLKEIENEVQKISKDNYTTGDIEYLLDSVKVILDKKKQAEADEIPF